MLEIDLTHTNNLYKQLKIDKDLATEFSILFSRFEYALKRTSRYAIERSNKVEADWNSFAKDHDSDFNSERTAILKSAVDYLETKPPRKQVVRSGTLAWEDVELQNITRLEQINLAVRRVRNNLFHGGKFPDGPVEDPARNTTLLKSCITILEECLRLDDKVRSYFWSSPV